MRLRSLLLSILFFLTAVLTLSLKSKTVFSASEITIKPNENHGLVNQSLGITVPINNIGQYKNEFVSLFKGLNVYIKILNPTQTFYDQQEFIDLSNNGFNWYLGSTSYESADQSLAGFFAKSVNSQPVVEIIGYSTFDAQKTKDLKNKYPTAKIHAASWLFWPREQVRDTLQAVQPPTLEAISFRTQEDTSDTLFGDIHLMFDTMYDASQDISGGSVKINYPPNTVLSLSGIRTAGSSDQEIARRAGIISGAIISSVQSQDRAGKAPIRYIIAGDISSMNDQEKILLRHFANFINLKPQISWPLAISQNGSIWRNNEPVVGVVGKANDKFYMFIINAKTDGQQNIKIDDPADLSEYKYFSTTRGEGSLTGIGGKNIALQATETMVIYHPSQYSPPTTPPQATQTPTPTTDNIQSTNTPTPTFGPCQNQETFPFNFAINAVKVKDISVFNRQGLHIYVVNITKFCYHEFKNIKVSRFGNTQDELTLETPINVSRGALWISVSTLSSIFEDYDKFIHPISQDPSLLCTQITSFNGACGELATQQLRSQKPLRLGDANEDTSINVLDYEIYRRNVNKTGPDAFVDFNFDGKVDFKNGIDDDLEIFKLNFGTEGPKG